MFLGDLCSVLSTEELFEHEVLSCKYKCGALLMEIGRFLLQENRDVSHQPKYKREREILQMPRRNFVFEECFLTYNLCIALNCSINTSL